MDMVLASDNEDALRLFDDEGKPTKATEKAITFLKSFQERSKQTSVLIERFEELGILTEAKF